MKYLKYILFAIIFFIAIVTFTIIVEKGKSERVSLPKPSLRKAVEGKLSFTFSEDTKNIKLPSRSHVITFHTVFFDENLKDNISENLGFSGKPDTFKDSMHGLIYLWRDENYSLMITPSLSMVKYMRSTYQPPQVIDKQLSDVSIISTGDGFLSDMLGMSSESFKPISIDYYAVKSPSEGFIKTTREDAVMYQINYTHSIVDYEILTTNPSQPLTYVQILRDGSVYNSQATYYKEVLKSDKSYPLKDYQEIVNSTDDFVFVSVLDGYVNIFELEAEDIDKIEIESIKLTYLLDNPNSKTLHPVYLLEGNTNIKGYPKLKALFYLPAIKNL